MELVVAVGASGQIGLACGLPWHVPEDLRLFRALTLGKTLVMGRTTYESIGRPLPGRRTVVVTRRPDWTATESVPDPLDVLGERVLGELVVCGGAEVYAALLPHVSRIHMSMMPYDGPADAYFPALDAREWTVVRETPRGGFVHRELRRCKGAAADGGSSSDGCGSSDGCSSGW